MTELPYHLRADAAGAHCPACGRTTWARADLGQICGMRQPDGSRCEGRFPAAFADEPQP